MSEDSTSREQMQHAKSERPPQVYPLTPIGRRKKLLSKEERNEHVKQSAGSVVQTDEKPRDHPNKDDLKYLEIKRDVLKIKQELLNQSLVINYAVSSRPILNDSLSKSITLKSDQNPKSDPTHMNDQLSKKKGVVRDGDDDTSDVSPDTSADCTNTHSKITSCIKTPTKNNDNKQRCNENVSIRRSPWKKRPKTPLPEQTDNNYTPKKCTLKSNKSVKLRIGSPKHNNSSGNPNTTEDFLNDYNSKLINEGKSAFRTKPKGHQKQQMQTWVYDLICCQNYYSVGLYFGLLVLIIGIIFVAFKLYLTFILPRDKETTNNQHINQQHWDNPNLINPLGPDFDKVENQLHGFRSSDYSLQNLSNIQQSIIRHAHPTPRRRTSERQTKRKLIVHTPSKRVQKLTDILVKKDVVPTPTVTTSTVHKWNTHASSGSKRKVIPPVRYTGGNNNRYHLFEGNLFTTTVRPLTLTTTQARYNPYPYSDGNRRLTENSRTAGWQWNGFKWVREPENIIQQYNRPNENFIAKHNKPYSENIQNKDYYNPMNYVTTPTPYLTTPTPYVTTPSQNRFPTYPSNRYAAPQTTTAYQKWWQQYYSSLMQTKGNTQYNRPTISRYSANGQPSYMNGNPGWPYTGMNGYNAYGNGINNQGYYNSYPNIYLTTGRPISNQDVTSLLNYNNQLQSHLDGYINKMKSRGLGSEASGQSSGDGVEDIDTGTVKKVNSKTAKNKKQKKKKWKKKTKKKKKKAATTTTTTTTTTTPKTTTTVATTTTNSTTTVTTPTTTTTTTKPTTTTTTTSPTTSTTPVTTTSTMKTPRRTTPGKLVTFTNSFTNSFTNPVTMPSESPHRNTRNRDSNEEYMPDSQDPEQYIPGDVLYRNDDIFRTTFRNKNDGEEGLTQGREKIHIQDYHGAHYGDEISRFGSDVEGNPSTVSERDNIPPIYNEKDNVSPIFNDRRNIPSIFNEKDNIAPHFSEHLYRKHKNNKKRSKKYHRSNKYRSHSKNDDGDDDSDGDETSIDNADDNEGDDDDDKDTDDVSHDNDDDTSVPDSDGDRKVRKKSHKHAKRSKKHKIRHSGRNFDIEDEQNEEDIMKISKYRSATTQKPSKKHHKHTYLETVRELHKKRKHKSKKGKSKKDHRIQLLAAIQHRIEALQNIQKMHQSKEQKGEKFLEEVGHKQSEIKQVKKSCASIKSFQPGTVVKIIKGPQRRHGKIIYSLRACRKVLVDDDVRIKCKDIEYKISGGKLTVRGERRGRTKIFSILACRDHSGGSGDF